MVAPPASLPGITAPVREGPRGSGLCRHDRVRAAFNSVAGAGLGGPVKQRDRRGRGVPGAVGTNSRQRSQAASMARQVLFVVLQVSGARRERRVFLYRLAPRLLAALTRSRDHFLARSPIVPCHQRGRRRLTPLTALSKRAGGSCCGGSPPAPSKLGRHLEEPGTRCTSTRPAGSGPARGCATGVPAGCRVTGMGEARRLLGACRALWPGTSRQQAVFSPEAGPVAGSRRAEESQHQVGGRPGPGRRPQRFAEVRARARRSARAHETAAAGSTSPSGRLPVTQSAGRRTVRHAEGRWSSARASDPGAVRSDRRPWS